MYFINFSVPKFPKAQLQSCLFLIWYRGAAAAAGDEPEPGLMSEGL